MRKKNVTLILELYALPIGFKAEDRQMELLGLVHEDEPCSYEKLLRNSRLPQDVFIFNLLKLRKRHYIKTAFVVPRGKEVDLDDEKDLSVCINYITTDRGLRALRKYYRSLESVVYQPCIFLE